MKSKVRNIDTDDASEEIQAENGGHVPRAMTWREFCFYSDEGLTIQEIKFADAYTDTPDLLKAALQADVEEHIAKAWGTVALKNPQVKRRIEDNLAVARRSSVMSVRERQERLTNIARSDIVDCLTVKGGAIEIDLEKAVKHGSSQGIVSIKIDDKFDSEGGGSRSRSLQMTNPISAMQELNKMQNHYDKKTRDTGAVVIIPAEDLEL